MRGQAGPLRLGLKASQSPQQGQAGLTLVLGRQQVDAPVRLAQGFGRGGTVGRHQVEGRRVGRQQLAEDQQRALGLPGLQQHLALQDIGPGRLGCAALGLGQQVQGQVGMPLGLGHQRLLAEIVGDAVGERPRACGLEFCGNVGRLGPVARALIQRQQRQAGFALEGGAAQHRVGVLRAVKQPGLEEVLGQLVLGTGTVGLGEITAAQQVLVHAHGALGLATAAEQAAQRKVQFRGVRVVLDRLDEGVNGLVLLFVEQQVQAFEIGLGRLTLFELPLPRIELGGQPAEDEDDGQDEKQPARVKLHLGGQRRVWRARQQRSWR
mmetsp:Transcript_70461/g.166094  ORF Transcript_70461/g.166094 Transcript_70461/m.166094 type:complete len:322 (-) Transcript_70461:270-1235(-)